MDDKIALSNHKYCFEVWTWDENGVQSIYLICSLVSQESRPNDCLAKCSCKCMANTTKGNNNLENIDVLFYTMHTDKAIGNIN